MSKKQHHEEHVDETWLLPYSDMLTLLLALFIVMFAMSKVDSDKFKKLSQQFNVIFSGGTGVLKDGGGNAGNVILPDSSSSSVNNSVVEQDMMVAVKNSLEQEIKDGNYQNKIKVDLNNEGLNISIQDTVIFKSGDAQIIDKFDPVLMQISNMIRNLDNDIRVSGHTDNVPINNSKFNSNWDLSYKRALNVMNFMIGKGKVRPDKFIIQACGEYNPKYDNSTADGRAKNRRVDILIVRKYASSTNNTK
jgi:chemotaxis protein MotB